MGERLLKKLNFIMGLAPIGALFGLIVFVANIEIRDLDLWLHIGAGRHMMQNKVIPLVDFLSCTIHGQPWNNHEWLFQIIVFNLYDTWGPTGLIKMQVVVVFITMLLLFFSWIQSGISRS